MIVTSQFLSDQVEISYVDVPSGVAVLQQLGLVTTA